MKSLIKRAVKLGKLDSQAGAENPTLNLLRDVLAFLPPWVDEGSVTPRNSLLWTCFHV